jgi:hypothetical protein
MKTQRIKNAIFITRMEIFNVVNVLSDVKILGYLGDILGFD